MNAAALFEAVQHIDLAEVQRILKHNPDIVVDALGQYRRTPLLIAIKNKQKPIVEVLLAHGAAANGPVGAFTMTGESGVTWGYD